MSYVQKSGAKMFFPIQARGARDFFICLDQELCAGQELSTLFSNICKLFSWLY